jgi:hypothetical protein
MATIIDSLQSILQTLTLNPSSPLVMYATIAFSVIAAWFGFTKTIAALKLPMNAGFRPVLSLVAFVAICLLSATLTKAYGSPRVSSAALSKFLPLIVAAVLFFAAAIPLACFLMKSRYGQTLSAFIVPLIAATIVVFLAKGIAGAVEQGGKGFSKTKDRTEGVDQVLAP